jgi:hypothetical protein
MEQRAAQRPVNEVEADIAKVEVEIAAIRSKGEEVLQRFFAATGEHLKTWLPTKVQEYALVAAAVTKALGARLTEFKGEVSALAASLPEKVPSWLNDDGFWRHRDGFAEAKDHYVGDYHHHGVDDENGPNLIHEALQGAIDEELLPMLRRYGYKVDEHTHAFHLSWRGAMQVAFKPYVDLIVEMLRAENKLAALRAEKMRAEVKDLWDKA